MKNLLFLLAFHLVIQNVICQQFSTNQRGTLQKNYYAEIPYKSIGGLVIIKAKINEEEHNFIFDSGALTSIKESLARKLGLKATHKLLISDSGNKKDSLSTTSINKISIGDISFEQIPILMVPDSLFFFDCYNNAEGTIGCDLFGNSIINISSKRGTIIITDSLKNIKPNPQNPQKLIVEPSQSLPIITVYILGRENASLELLFDSGMAGLFDLSLGQYNMFKKYDIFESSDSTKGTVSLGLWGNAKDTTLYKIVAPKLIINQMELSNVRINTTADNNSRIGAAIFNYTDVTLDYINNLFYLSPINDNKIDCESKEYPIQFTLIGGKLCIGAIWGISRFPEINVGDKIISIDSINCQELSRCEQLFIFDYISGKDSIKIVTKDKVGNKHSTWLKME